MTAIDVRWFNRCRAAGLVKGRMLEVGSAKVDGNRNLCEIARESGVADTIGVDLARAEGVDSVVDFALPLEDFRRQWRLGNFSTVCVFNVLEHVFDPIRVLANAITCAEPNGIVLTVTPSVWPIHNYPGDYTRLLPDWYRAFARCNAVTLIDDHFCWLSQFGIEVIGDELEPTLPTYRSRGVKASRTRYWTSRLVHKVLNTYGHLHWATSSAIAAAFHVG